MKRRGAFVALLVVIALLGAGCGDLVEQYKQTREDALAVQEEATAALLVLEAEAAKLPAGKERENIEAQIANVKKVLAQVDRTIQTVDETIASLEKGELSPALQEQLSKIPYGVYLGFGLSAIAALYQRYRRNDVLSDFKRVVQSFEVGEALTDEQKLQVRALQGEKTTARVQQVKKELGID